MQETRLKVQIKRPISEVFSFAINPKNTPKWVEGIAIEETNEWPVKVGSIYRSQSKSGKWSEYTVTSLEENKIFFLTKNDNNLHVKYTFMSISPVLTELEYELVHDGEFKESFIQGLLDNLKKVMESEL